MHPVADGSARPSRRPTPEPAGVVDWVTHHLGHLARGAVTASGSHVGTQAAADAALAALDLRGYAGRRNEVLPVARRGATALSPWIRHGLLTLPRVWSAASGPSGDVEKFHDELLWQEYARHLYARLGARMAAPLRAAPTRPPVDTDPAILWDTEMRCVATVLDELHRDGWIVNQTRMWLASHWYIRGEGDWRAGEDEFFAHLLDGSRAANRAGWQWTAGLATGRPYGFSRSQVERRAPGLCDGCSRRHACPIQQWPDEPALAPVAAEPLLRHDPDPEHTAGPREPERSQVPDCVWLTAESLGDDDPAMAAHPDLPVVFVFDETLLARLRLAGHRLVFLTERLAELGATRALEVHVGDPVDVLRTRHPAVTFAPVPGWRRRAAAIGPAEVHPWPWLRRPDTGSLASWSAWRGGRTTSGRSPRANRSRRP